jgi:hypothetical protein
MARGGHGLPKLLLLPIMPNPSMPCRRAACGRLLPYWTTHAVRLWFWRDWPFCLTTTLFRLGLLPLPLLLIDNDEPAISWKGNWGSGLMGSWGSWDSSAVSLGPAIPCHSMQKSKLSGISSWSIEHEVPSMVLLDQVSSWKSWGIEGLGIAGPSDTLGSPWPLLAVRLSCLPFCLSCLFS